MSNKEYDEKFTPENVEKVLKEVAGEPKKRRITVSTGRMGIINWEMALWEEAKRQCGQTYTEEQSQEYRRKVEEAYPLDGIYTIKI